MDQAGVRTAIEPLVDALRADGAEVEVLAVDGGRVALRLLLADASCAECVMPAETLEPLFLDAIAGAGHEVAAVSLDDPRGR